MKILCTKDWEKWDEERRIKIENLLYRTEDDIMRAKDFNNFINNKGRNKSVPFSNYFFMQRYVYKKIQLRLLCRYQIYSNEVELHMIYCKNETIKNKKNGMRMSSNDQGAYYDIFKKYIDEFNKNNEVIL